MKSKSNFSRSQTAFCCVVAALLIPALFLSSHITNNELTLYTKQTLNEISMQNVNSINSKVEDDFILLEEISDRIANDPSYESILAGLKSASAAYGFKRMGIVDAATRKAYCSDDAELNIANEPHIIRSLGGERSISDIFPDMADGRTIFVYSVPIFNKDNSGVVDGVYFATCDTDTFRNHLEVSAFGGREYTYIVKSDGTTVIDSAHEASYKDMKNAFTAMESVGDNKETADRMREEMSLGMEGCLPFRNNGELRYINYAPLGINDWYILSVVSSEVTDGPKVRIMLVTYAVDTLIVLIAIIFVTAIIRGEKSKQAELERILYVDDLTGGISFTKFCIDAAELLERQDKSVKAACVMADLDNFRLINNLYGKAEGDKTILNSYKALGAALGEGDLLTRRIADRFYALIFFKEKSELDKKLTSFIDELRNSDEASGNEYIINPSIGVYIIDETAGEDMETITNNATIAHDTIMSRGDRIAYYDEAQRDRLKANKQLEDKMELAHKNHEFIPYFQPKYNAETGRICGAEALVRWRNPDGSVTPPGKFIPLAESNGFIRVLDRDIFNAVCAFQRKILDSGTECVPISVNVSRQLMYEQNFAEDYIETIRRYDLSPDLIELEITESVLFDDYSVFRSIINTLREYGFRILMDDFGTGYSSLMMLRSIPIDNLKLDKSFIDSFEEEKGRKIIVCVIELAKSLCLPLTAEGVETRGQYDFLKSMGCDVIQGFYFSKPVPEETFTEMLKADQTK